MYTQIHIQYRFLCEILRNMKHVVGDYWRFEKSMTSNLVYNNSHERSAIVGNLC